MNCAIQLIVIATIITFESSRLYTVDRASGTNCGMVEADGENEGDEETENKEDLSHGVETYG
jgi:hypothetical protein